LASFGTPRPPWTAAHSSTPPTRSASPVSGARHGSTESCAFGRQRQQERSHCRAAVVLALTQRQAHLVRAGAHGKGGVHLKPVAAQGTSSRAEGERGTLSRGTPLKTRGLLVGDSRRQGAPGRRPVCARHCFPSRAET
jgi:hypothetical protein